MQDRPTAVELLKAAQEFCEKDLGPQLTGRLRFHVRVLQNVLSILEREWIGEEVALTNEWNRLRELLETHDTSPPTMRALAERVHAMNRELSARIRDGRLDERTGEILDALSATVGEKLAIANPNYASSTGASDRSMR